MRNMVFVMFTLSDNQYTVSGNMPKCIGDIHNKGMRWSLSTVNDFRVW